MGRNRVVIRLIGAVIAALLFFSLPLLTLAQPAGRLPGQGQGVLTLLKNSARVGLAETLNVLGSLTVSCANSRCTLDLRAGSRFDVRTLGAACDGTTDDAAAFESAYTTVSGAGGGVIVVPGGVTCRIGSDVLVKQNTALQCERGATLKATDNASFTDGMFTTFSLSKLQLTANNVSVEGCRLDLNGKKGPAVYLNGEDLILHRNTVFNGDTSEASDHSLLRMACSGGSNTNVCEVTANRVECANTSGAKDIGILIDAAIAVSTGVRVVGNSVYACDSYGIRGTGGLVSVSASNVTVTGTSGVGVALVGFSGVVLDTTVNASGDSGVGILLGGFGSMAIGNRVTVGGASGVAFYVAGVDAKVAMNDYALTSASSSSTAVGIYYTGGRIRIVGNTGNPGPENGDKTHVLVGAAQGSIVGNNFSGGSFGVVPSISELGQAINTNLSGNRIWAQVDTGITLITGWDADGNYLSWQAGCAVRLGEGRTSTKAGVGHGHLVGNRIHTTATGKGICFTDVGSSNNIATVAITGNEILASQNTIGIDIDMGVGASSSPISNVVIDGNVFTLGSNGIGVKYPATNQDKVTNTRIGDNTWNGNGTFVANFNPSMGSIGTGFTLQMTGAATCGLTTAYFGNSGCSTTESQVTWPAPTAFTVTSIACNQASDSTCTLRFTLRKNSADQTDLQCSSVNAAGCTDTGSVSFAANDTLAIKVEDIGGCTDSIGVSCIVSFAQ